MKLSEQIQLRFLQKARFERQLSQEIHQSREELRLWLKDKEERVQSGSQLKKLRSQS